MTKRRLLRNQNQAHWDAPFIVNGVHYALHNTIFPREKRQQTGSKKAIWWSKSQKRLTMMISWRCRLVRHEYVDGDQSLVTNIVSIYEQQDNAVGWCIGRSWERRNCIIYCHLCVAKKDTFLQHTFRLQHTNEKTSGCRVSSILLFSMSLYGWLLSGASWATQNRIAADRHVWNSQ